MTDQTPINKQPATLLERAADRFQYGPTPIGADIRAKPVRTVERRRQQKAEPNPEIVTSDNQIVPVKRNVPVRRHYDGPVTPINRQNLSAANFIVPGGPITPLTEEMQIVKRHLLRSARGSDKFHPVTNGERILITSAHEGEGKTFTAVNLALSMANERDSEVLLVDCDFARQSAVSIMGLNGSRGLLDAITDPTIDIEDCVIHTDVPGLSVLPAGRLINQGNELLASSQMDNILDQLSQNYPARIIIFDSPPVLGASTATVISGFVGQTLLVVKAESTTETSLKEALRLISSCDFVQLLLNKTKFSLSGRKLGSYYNDGG